MARLFFLSKRRPQQRCLLERPYGRFYHIPNELAKLGHDVHVLLIGHAGNLPETLVRNSVTWHTVDLNLNPLNLIAYCRKKAETIEPDWIIGLSDAWVGWLAGQVSSALDIKLAIDAYDDYEAYMPWNLPLHWLWRKAIGKADLCTAAGPQLAELLNVSRRGKSHTAIIPMAADPEFKPMLKVNCRKELGLPEIAPIIGYAGGWATNRGTENLIKAFRIVRQCQPDALLALTGNPPKHLLSETGVISLGYLQDKQMPVFINALDVSTVITANTRFGRHSYPVKLCEAMACEVPVVATATLPVKWMLNNASSHLLPVGDIASFANAILRQLQTPDTNYPTLNHWSLAAAHFNTLLQRDLR